MGSRRTQLLTPREQAILIGTLLGDGSLQATGRVNARLRLEHGVAQKDYLLWKAKELREVSPGGQTTYLSRVHPDTKQTYHYARYQSWAAPALGELRRIFYPSGQKLLPSDLSSRLLEPLSLAVWYMDDGYFEAKDKMAFLYLGTVSRGEAEVAQRAVAACFDVGSRVADKKSKGYALSFPVSETKKLFRLVSPHMLPLFSYKIS